MKFPYIKDIANELKLIKKEICDDYADEPGGIPYVQVTLACDDDGNWCIQVGDNSYTGCAYGYPYWAVGELTRRANTRDMAKDLISQIDQLTW